MRKQKRKAIYGNIQERNGRFCATPVFIESNGERIRQGSSTFPNWDEAQEFLTKQHNEYINDAVKPTKQTVRQYFEHWFDTEGKDSLELTTISIYRTMCNTYVYKFMGDMPIQAVKTSKIKEYRTFLKGVPLSNNTVNKHLILLNVIFRSALEDEIITKNPVAAVKKLPVEEPEIHFYDAEQAARLLKKIEGDSIEIIIILCLYVGMRRGEAVGLTWDHVDLEKRQVSVFRTIVIADGKCHEKGPKTPQGLRTLAFGQRVYDVLIRVKQEQEKNKAILGDEYDNGNYVIAKPNGSHYSPGSRSNRIKILIERYELDAIGLHGLRHSFATLYLSEGGNIYDLMVAMGHSTIASTMRYLHSLQRAEAKATSLVANCLDKAIEESEE